VSEDVSPETQACDRFDQYYQAGNAPWEIDQVQPELRALAEAEAIVGDVLDMGCGSGENSVYLAERGHMLWGIDISPVAIAKAQAKAKERHVDATFITGSALELEVLGEGFHTVIDFAMFHVLDDAQRQIYLKGLHHVMFPNSRLYLLCFSELEPEGWGPRRVQKSEIRHLFTAQNGFKVKDIKPARYLLKERPEGVQAWLAKIICIEN